MLGWGVRISLYLTLRGFEVSNITQNSKKYKNRPPSFTIYLKIRGKGLCTQLGTLKETPRLWYLQLFLICSRFDVIANSASFIIRLCRSSWTIFLDRIACTHTIILIKKGKKINIQRLDEQSINWY